MVVIFGPSLSRPVEKTQKKRSPRVIVGEEPVLTQCTGGDSVRDRFLLS